MGGWPFSCRGFSGAALARWLGSRGFSAHFKVAPERLFDRDRLFRFQRLGDARQGRDQMLLDQLVGSPGGLGTVGQNVQELGRDLDQPPDNPARKAAAPRAMRAMIPITWRSPQVNWASDSSERDWSRKIPRPSPTKPN